MAVGDPDAPLARGLEAELLVGVLDLGHGRVGPAVGVDHAVAAEVAVGGGILVAEVAAVGPEGAPLGVVRQQTLVDPVPDEAALHVGIGVDRIPLPDEVARRVTHGVGVLRGGYGAVAAAAADRREPCGAGVLRHVHVGVPLPLRALVVDRAVHQPAVGLFHIEIGLVEVVAVARLVAQRPEGHAGVVLVALEHVARAVHVGGQPLGIVAQRAAAAQVVVHAVRLDVGLVVDVDAVLVAQLVEAAVLRVVAQTHGVEVVALHQLEVAAHELLVDVVARALVVLVHVHALELHGLSVDQQHAVGFAVLRALLQLGHLDAAEAHVVGDHLRGAVALLERQQHAVEVGRLGAPRRHVGEGLREAQHGALARSDGRPLAARGHAAARGVEELVAELRRRGLRAVVAHLGLDAEDAVAVAVVERRAQAEVAHGHLGLRPEEDVALDAADAPEVLALQIRPRAVAVDDQRQLVLALLQIVVEEVLGGVLRILVVAHLAAVDEDVDARLGAGQVEVDVAPLPPGGNLEGAAVDARGHRLGQLGRLRLVGAEVVLVVGVDGRAEALRLPVARHADVGPRGVVERGRRGVGGQRAAVVGVEELPRAVEQTVEVAPLVALRERRRAVGVGHEGRTGRNFVHRHDLRVEAVGGRGPVGGRRGSEGQSPRQPQRREKKVAFHRRWLGFVLCRDLRCGCSPRPARRGGDCAGGYSHW